MFGITKEMQIELFEIMVGLIKTKGASNKMVSIFDIHDAFKKKGVDTSKQIISPVLDVLIQHKYVRYYRREGDGYIYFGISELGWTRWKERNTPPTAQVQQEISPDGSNTPPWEEEEKTSVQVSATSEKDWKPAKTPKESRAERKAKEAK